VKLSDFPNGQDPQAAVAAVLYPIAQSKK
jgi:hypothetical protein